MSNVIPLQAGGRIAGIVPTDIEQVFRLAKAVAASGMAPYGMNTPEQITIAIMHGLELGLPPMQAIQRIAVVNGRPTVWGDAIPALLLSRGFKLREWIEGAGDTRAAFCEVTRPDGDTTTRSFSIGDAKRAKLWQTQEKVRKKNRKTGEFFEGDNDSPWFRYPERMLAMRARGFAARDGAADVLGGLYLREEVDDEPMKDITPAKEVVRPGDGQKALPPVVGEEPADNVDWDAVEAKVEAERAGLNQDEGTGA